jgi:serine/threonine protein kinase
LASSSTADKLLLDRAQDTWTVLSERVESFVQAWSHPEAEPRLAEFAPTSPASLRRLVLIELIKVDMEYRREPGRRLRPIDEYLAEFPELATDGAPCDLVYEEIHLRRQAGEAVEAESYFQRFPRQANELRRLLGVQEAARSSSLTRARDRAALNAGDQIDDFDLLTLLGTGAYAQVFLARQRSMQRLVALKAAAERGDEPQTLAQLDHPHVVRVYDQRPVPDRGLHLLYMQYVAGGSLQDVLELVRQVPDDQRSGRILLDAIDRVMAARGESPPVGSTLRERLARMRWPEAVCWLGARTASALGYAHRQGVLHRDVKPANVLLTPEGAPKLADFNISFSSKVEGASPEAFFGGSLAYMSPEQLEAFNPAHPRAPNDLDGRSDLYSLGVVLWELSTGYRPFPPEALAEDWSDTIAGMTADRRDGPDESASSLPVDSPRGFAETLRTCLASEPSQRPGSGEELARELDLCLHPDARALLYPPTTGWRALVRRMPILTIFVVGLLPNLFAALYNLAYNYREIVANWEGAESAFWTVQAIINSTSYPLGLVLFYLWLRPVTRALRQQGPLPIDEALRVKLRCLKLGEYGVAISLIGWIIAGFAYPIGLTILLGDVPTKILLHFFISLVLSGLIAAGYPFFTLNFLIVRVLFPALRPGANPAVRAALNRLGRQTWFYLLLTASVPMLAMTVLVFAGVGQSTLLAILGIGGLAGFGVAFWLARAIQNDLEALAVALSPTIDGLADGSR